MTEEHLEEWQYTVRSTLHVRTRLEALLGHIGKRSAIHRPKLADAVRIALQLGIEALEEEERRDARAAAQRARRAAKADGGVE